MVGERIIKEKTTASDSRIWGIDIGDGQQPGERRTPWRGNVGSVCYDKYEGRPGGRMILCRGVTGGVERKIRRQTLH